jgi:anti-sigma factor RsiW
MSCEHFVPLLLREAEGRLNEALRLELEAHLTGCAACREALAAQRDVAAALGSRPDAPPPARFAARVAESIREESSWFAVADWRWLSVRVAPVAAALLIVAAILVGQRQPQAPQRISLAKVVETWAAGDGERVPAPAILWQANVSDDSLLLTVLAAQPDATIGRSE